MRKKKLAKKNSYWDIVITSRKYKIFSQFCVFGCLRCVVFLRWLHWLTNFSLKMFSITKVFLPRKQKFNFHLTLFFFKATFPPPRNLTTFFFNTEQILTVFDFGWKNPGGETHKKCCYKKKSVIFYFQPNFFKYFL